MLHYLFDASSFANHSQYGQGWQPWLFWTQVWRLGITALAYGIFVWAFSRFGKAWKLKQVDEATGAIQLVRVGRMFQFTCAFELALTLCQIRSLWYPWIRFLGVFGLVVSLVLLAAAMKMAVALEISRKLDGP